MTKQETYAFLKEQGVEYEATEHRAVYNMDELADVELPHPEADAKNLFVRDDKKANYYLITVTGDQRVNLKYFKRAYGTRNLTFASPDDLMRFLKLTPGSVTPLGVLNDSEKAVKVYLDKSFLSGDGLIGVHPNDNTATVWLKAADLIEIIKNHGNEINVVEV